MNSCAGAFGVRNHGFGHFDLAAARLREESGKADLGIRVAQRCRAMLGNHTSHIPGVLSLAPSAARGQRLPYLRHALWLWLPLAFAVTTALMVGHWVTLPKPEVGDVQLAAAIAALRDAGAPRGWFAAHVLYAALLRVGDSTAMLGHELVIEIVDDGRGVAVHGEPGAGTRVSFRFPQMAAAPPVLGAQHAA